MKKLAMVALLAGIAVPGVVAAKPQAQPQQQQSQTAKKKQNRKHSAKHVRKSTARHKKTG